MIQGKHITRALALSTALSVAALGATTTAAQASLDPGHAQSQGQAKGQDKSQGKSQGKATGHRKKKSTSSTSSSDQDGSASAPGTGSGQAKGHHKDGGASQGDQSTGNGPASQGQGSGAKGGSGTGGNNGTVKIDGWTLDHGTGNGAPNRNEPHVDCTFDVEWYNFDASVTSTVTFAMHAPTSDVGLGSYVTSVPLDGDDASGANAEGIDAVQPYELVFDGEPHPKHGYHVKLTVNTPETVGSSDVKHKVFWVEGCEEETPPTTPETPPTTPETPPTTPETPPTTPEVEGEQGNDLVNDIEVLGEQANVDSEISSPQADQAVPGAVDAGLGDSAVSFSPVSSLPLMVTLYGALLAGLALVLRRRRTS